ncbi:MAG: trehalose-6-phosphate synthase [Candidatus Makaraimicrobium thalassicum]|nr:MAG: trehalose-6-phosphate synthase [Candidatus Omnitrophota bacterium]
MIHFKGKDRQLIVVSNRLPFSRRRDKNGKFVWEKAAGGLITAMEPILQDTSGIWLGWDGVICEDAKEEKLSLIDIKDIGLKQKNAERSYQIGCVHLTRVEYEEYYNHFSNGTLWSLFHYFFEKCFLDYSSWDTYRKVNERFARCIDEISSKDDIVWIQDFHLFMTPYYLRQLRPAQEIHFFLHVPFPHIDIFSILPWQKQILESLLCCDTVGFQHKGYMRNFAGAVDLYRKEKKLFKKKTLEEGITTHSYVNPISIDFDLLDRTSRDTEVRGMVSEIRSKASCPKQIIGVDRMDYSKGIKERLLGLEVMLDDHPELKEQFFYYQLIIPSREEVGAYRNIKKEIDEMIGRINGEFSTGFWAPIHYNYGTLDFKELVALYMASDVALITPLRDGMNLVCKEYVATHSDNDGILVLSKFAGAIAEIKNCLPVNPYSIEDIASAIYQALNMPKKEREKRMKRMRRNIKSNNITTWLENCLRNFRLSPISLQPGEEKNRPYETFD